MPIQTDSLNKNLYDLLKVRGYEPIPKDAVGQTTPVPNDAEVFKFTYTNDDRKYGSAWVTIDGKDVIVYFDDSITKPTNEEEGSDEIDNSWTGFLQTLKTWAQRHQLGFVVKNHDHLASDMAQRNYMKKEENIHESVKNVKEEAKWRQGYRASGHPPGFKHKTGEIGPLGGTYTTHDEYGDEKKDPVNKYRDEKDPLSGRDQAGIAQKGHKLLPKNKAKNLKLLMKQAKGKHGPVPGAVLPENVNEGYYPMGKKASYSDNVPNVKIVIQHTRQIEEGEQRFRNVERIFLENTNGERFLAPTVRPGIARVYARHIAEGGVPNDERWNHIKSLCEEYGKMAGFVRAVRNHQFNESAQRLVNEGLNHYISLREMLSKMTGHRGYNNYFESWTPTLMETEDINNLNELFVQETLDPRIESVMPILSRLSKNITETEIKEVTELEEWANDVIGEQTDLKSIPESKMSEAHALLQDIANGNVDMRDIMNHPKDKIEMYVAKMLQDMYDEISVEHGLHQDDDFEQIEARIYDELADKYGENNLNDTNLANSKDPYDTDDPAPMEDSSETGSGEMIGRGVGAGLGAAAGGYLGKSPAGVMMGAEIGGDIGAGLGKMFDKKSDVVDEDLGPEQNRVGQLDPTEKITKSNPTRGKLVGANENIETKLKDASRARKINESDNFIDSLLSLAKKINPTARISGSPEEERERRDQLILQREKDRINRPSEPELSPEQRTNLELKLKELQSKFDPDYQYSDDYTVWSKQDEIAKRIADIKDRLSKNNEQGVAEGEGKTQKYEMMMRNGQVKRFTAKDDADAKRIAAGHGAKSVIKMKGNVPGDKIAEQGVAEAVTGTHYNLYVDGKFIKTFFEPISAKKAKDNLLAKDPSKKVKLFKVLLGTGPMPVKRRSEVKEQGVAEGQEDLEIIKRLIK